MVAMSPLVERVHSNHGDTRERDSQRRGLKMPAGLLDWQGQKRLPSTIAECKHFQFHQLSYVARSA